MKSCHLYKQNKKKNTASRSACGSYFSCLYSCMNVWTNAWARACNVHGRGLTVLCILIFFLHLVANHPFESASSRILIPHPAVQLCSRFRFPESSPSCSPRHRNNITENKTITLHSITLGPCDKAWIIVGLNPRRCRWSLATNGRREWQRGSPAVDGSGQEAYGPQDSFACFR